MIDLRLLGCVLVLGGPLAAQSATGRWSLQIRGDVMVERGDLRLDSTVSRLLLESQDDTWIALSEVHHDDTLISFRAGQSRRFEGVVEPDVMSGRVFDANREVGAWEARRIQPGTDRWPVRPRITVRQLITGSDDTLASFAREWHGRILSRDALLAEHAALARDAGFPPADIQGIVARSQRTMLGFDDDARRAAQDLLEQIATTPAANVTFRGLFRTADGGWRVDLHDVAWQLAAQQQDSPIEIDVILRELAGRGVRADSSSVVQSVWQYWGRYRSATRGTAASGLIASPDSADDQRLETLLTAYDSAVSWWHQAIRWLMTSRWIETAAGWQSPVDLVRRFWDDDALALPTIEPHHFGGLQAVPVVGAGRVGELLLVAENAIATEWLADSGNRDEALETWRRLNFRESIPLRMAVGDRNLRVVSAAQVAQSRLGGFLASRDLIRIEPAIIPVFAVGTVVHEWQHLLFEAARLAHDPPLAFEDAQGGVTLIEADPWLGEGAAEWATEAVLGPTRAMTPLFVLLEAEKRLGISAGIPDDTHVLGYLLVRTAVNRLTTSGALRRTLVEHLHDPAGFAKAVGLGDHGFHTIPRPSTLMVIPEVTFTMDGGVADDVTRRLVVPEPSPES